MSKRTTRIGIYILAILLIASCKSYYIPISSFNEQMKDVRFVEMKTVNTQGPMGDIVSYKTYPIEYIKCVDRNNNPFELKSSPSIEIRLTEKNNKRSIFYFDQIYVQNSMIIGDGSRFIHYRKAIPIENLKLIEVQEGRKNFKYVDLKK